MAEAPKFRKKKQANPLELLIIRDVLKQRGEERKQAAGIETEQRKSSRLPTEELVKARRPEEEQKRQQTFNLNRVVSLLEKTVGQQRARFEEQANIPGLTGFGLDFGQEQFKFGGPIRGKLGSMAAGLRIPGFERSGTTKGQQVEASLALNNILTGQNRAIKSIIDRIAATLPGDVETPQSMEEKIAQTVRNSFGLFKSLNDAGFTQEFLNSFSDEELADANSAINQQISALPFTELNPDEEKAAQQLIDQILSTPAVELQPGRDPVTGQVRGETSPRSPIPGSPGNVETLRQQALEALSLEPGRETEIRDQFRGMTGEDL